MTVGELKQALAPMADDLPVEVLVDILATPEYRKLPFLFNVEKACFHKCTGLSQAAFTIHTDQGFWL